MIAKAITYFGQPAILICDANCKKAFGINGRARIQIGKDEDDWAYAADGEVGEAPVDPGTYEGCDGKPVRPEDRLNRWCCRECERSTMAAPGEDFSLRNFAERLCNMPEAK